MPPPDDPRPLAARVCAGERRALARAITLVESTRPEDETAAAELLAAVLPTTGGAIRVGISGAPGVGKSTFIEALGGQLLAAGRRVAVLAVDPSSSISRGSILGDKTRMPLLSAAERAFVRPSPSGGALGGVARRTREALLLCEAAGHDVVLVETVGVGQSEVAVAGMTDHFLLLALAGAGDELQGIKRGVLELVDLLAITKADGDNRGPAERARAEFASALALLRGGRGERVPDVMVVSAVSGQGIAELWAQLVAAHEAGRTSGAVQSRRTGQRLAWFREAMDEELRRRFLARPGAVAALAACEAAVLEGDRPPRGAARWLVEQVS